MSSIVLFETAPETTRESSSTKSRCALTPSLRRLIKLSISKRPMCLPLKKKLHENIVFQPSTKATGCSARACCSAVPRLSNQGARVLLLFGQVVQGGPCLLCDGRNAAASATRRCICSIACFHRVLPANSSATKEAGENCSPQSEGRCPPLQDSPICAHSNDQHRDEHERNSRGNPSVPATPSKRPPGNSPERVYCQVCQQFLGIWRKSYRASAR